MNRHTQVARNREMSLINSMHHTGIDSITEAPNDLLQLSRDQRQVELVHPQCIINAQCAASGQSAPGRSPYIYQSRQDIDGRILPEPAYPEQAPLSAAPPAPDGPRHNQARLVDGHIVRPMRDALGPTESYSFSPPADGGGGGGHPGGYPEHQRLNQNPSGGPPNEPPGGDQHGCAGYPGPQNGPPQGPGDPGQLTQFDRPAMFPVRQWDVIRIPDLPTVRTRKQWVYALKVLIVSASGWRNDRAVTIWIDEAVDTRRGWDDLINSGHDELMTLDFKLAEALMQFFQSDNKTDSAQRLWLKRQNQMDTEFLIARGRQILNHIFQDLSLQMYYSSAFNVMTLARVHCVGNNIADFNNRWFAVLSELPMQLDVDSLLDMYLEQLRKAPVLRDDLRWFDALPRVHPLKNYQWLLTLTEKYINRHKEEKLARAYTDCASKPSLFNIVHNQPGGRPARHNQANAAVESQAFPFRRSDSPRGRRSSDRRTSDRRRSDRSRSSSRGSSRSPGQKSRSPGGKRATPKTTQSLTITGMLRWWFLQVHSAWYST